MDQCPGNWMSALQNFEFNSIDSRLSMLRLEKQIDQNEPNQIGRPAHLEDQLLSVFSSSAAHILKNVVVTSPKHHMWVIGDGNTIGLIPGTSQIDALKVEQKYLYN